MTRKEILKRDLPAEHICIDFDSTTNKGVAIYYDYDGATFCEDNEIQEVYGYITAVIEERLGFKVRVTEWGESNNGHFNDHFEKI